MNTPGYTAEASLYSRGCHCYVAEGDASMAEVVPQALSFSRAAGQGTAEQGISSDWWRCWYFGSCMICCNPWWCWWACWNRAVQA
jgi:hypothetical protein